MKYVYNRSFLDFLSLIIWAQSGKAFKTRGESKQKHGG